MRICLFETLLNARYDSLPAWTGGIRRQGCKLVSAEAGQDVRIAERLFQSIRGSDQRRISHVVAKGIVDLFQIVHVAEKEQGVFALAVSQFQLMCRRGQKTTPIVKPGEFIGDGQTSNFAIDQ